MSYNTIQIKNIVDTYTDLINLAVTDKSFAQLSTDSSSAGITYPAGIYYKNNGSWQLANSLNDELVTAIPISTEAQTQTYSVQSNYSTNTLSVTPVANYKQATINITTTVATVYPLTLKILNSTAFNITALTITINSISNILNLDANNSFTISVPNNTTAKLFNNNKKIIATYVTYDTTITPVGDQNIDGNTVLPSDTILIADGTHIAFYKGAAIGVPWTILMSFDYIQKNNLMFQTSSTGLNFRNVPLFPMLNDTYMQMLFPPVSNGVFTVNATNGVDSIKDANELQPYRSIAFAGSQANSIGNINSDGWSIVLYCGIEGSSAAFNEVITSSIFTYGNNQSIVGVGNKFVKGIVFDCSDPFETYDWKNINLQNISFGNLFAQDGDIGIHFKQTSTNNISVAPDSSIIFAGNVTLGIHTSTVDALALKIDANVTGNIYLDFQSGINFEGDIELLGNNYNVTIDGPRQYTRTNTAILGTIGTQPSFENSVVRVPSPQFTEGFGMNFILNNNALIITNGNLQFGSITINGTYNPATGNYTRVFLLNCIVGASFNIINNSNIPIQISSPSNIGTDYLINPNPGFSYTFTSFKDTLYISSGAFLSNGTVTMPQDDFVNDGQVISIFTKNQVTALTVSPSATQTVAPYSNLLLPSNPLQFSYDKANKRWLLFNNSSKSYFKGIYTAQTITDGSAIIIDQTSIVKSNDITFATLNSTITLPANKLFKIDTYLNYSATDVTSTGIGIYRNNTPYEVWAIPPASTTPIYNCAVLSTILNTTDSTEIIVRIAGFNTGFSVSIKQGSTILITEL